MLRSLLKTHTLGKTKQPEENVEKGLEMTRINNSPLPYIFVMFCFCSPV